MSGKMEPVGTRSLQRVFQFKIVLKGIRPPIWRRIQVPETYSFWDLHVAIQDAMGWVDYHLHEFTIRGTGIGCSINIGMPDDEAPDRVLLGWTIPVSHYLTLERPRANYAYDFGDGWEHTVTLEKVLPAAKSVKYPICVSGRRHCPPEDCGGTYGYEEFLSIISDPTHPEHREMLVWAGGKFDPESFDPKAVKFDDPAARWRTAFLEG